MKKLLTSGIAAAAFGVLLPASPARGATYIMMADPDLIAQAPIVVLVRAGESAAEAHPVENQLRPFTVTSFEIEETLKGSIASPFLLRLPGGSIDENIWWVPGRPRFNPGEEDLLFIYPIADGSGDYGLTEFGLSKFEIYNDETGNRFAGRSVFLTGQELAPASMSLGSAPGDDLRDSESFVEAIQSLSAGKRATPIKHSAAIGSTLHLMLSTPALTTPKDGQPVLAPEWVNLNGTEPGGSCGGSPPNCLFKWFWDNYTDTTCDPTQIYVPSPSGKVEIDGTQSQLSDSSDGTAIVESDVNAWASVASSTVDYSNVSSGGNVVVNLDVTNESGSWSGAFDCNGSGGEIGLGGVTGAGFTHCVSFGTFAFKGDTTYLDNQTGEVWMRTWKAGCSYPVSIFKTAVLHELGHTLGLGHPDTQTNSSHSTTSSLDHSNAVMASVVEGGGGGSPQVPQTDDIQAIQFYYGSFGNPGPPVAAFSFTPNSPITNQSVQFTDTSSNSPTSWAWNFGDPTSGAANTSTLKNPAHAFAAATSYTVTLTATNGSGPSSPVQHTVVVSSPPPPTASFTFSPTGPMVGQSVQFTDTSTGSPTSWLWNFGDPTSGAANTSTSKNPTHAFASATSYTVTLTSTNGSGSSLPVQHTVVVSSPPPSPMANFTFSPGSPVVAQSVQFTDTSTNNPTSFSWNFGDGSTSTLKNPTHVYAGSGIKTVLHGASNAGGTGSDSKTVTVGPAPDGGPAAAFNFVPSAPAEGQAVQFTDASTGAPTSWSWDFGDPGSGASGSSMLQNPTHAFSVCGSFLVTFTAANSHGSSVAQQTVTAGPDSAHRLAAKFSASPNSAITGIPVAFTDLSAGDPTSWAWNFGDPGSGPANVSTIRNPTHSYSTAGKFNVSLTVANSCGSDGNNQALTVSLPAPTTRTATITSAGHIGGKGGVVFVTDAELENPAGIPAAGNLVFTPADGGPAKTVPLSLGPHETRVLNDVVFGTFGESGVQGALRIDTSGNPPASLRLSSRTYDTVAGGTLGLAIAAVTANPYAGSRFVTGLAQTSGYRTNLGAVNDTSSRETFEIILYNPSGSVAGVSAVQALGPGGQIQYGLSNLFPSASGSGLTAEIRPVNGGNSPLAYGTVTDNLSADPTYYPGQIPASDVYLDGVSQIAGQGGAYFRSELSFANVSDATQTVTVAFVAANHDNATPASRTFTLEPRSTRHFDDLLQQLFGLTGTYGAVEVTSNSAAGLAVADRIYTAAPSGSGTTGQQVDPIAAGGFFPAGALLGLRQDSTFRTNVGFLNPTLGFVSATLTLRLPSGTTLASTPFSLAPHDYVLRTLGQLFPATAFPPGTPLTLEIDAGSGLLFANSSVIDNTSSDPTTSPELP